MTKLQAFRCPVELAELLEQKMKGTTKTKVIVEALRESLQGKNCNANVGGQKKSTVSNFASVNGALGVHN